MLYTRKGDAGTTKLFKCDQNERITKSALVFEVLGSVDELNTMVGYAKVLAHKETKSPAHSHPEVPITIILETIQHQLFSLQAELAGSDMKITHDHVLYLEKILQEIETIIPPIHTFILPGGTESSAYIDITRTNARRTERKYVLLTTQEPERLNPDASAYLNRLSSILYALARFINYQQGQTEQSPRYNT